MYLFFDCSLVLVIIDVHVCTLLLAVVISLDLKTISTNNVSGKLTMGETDHGRVSKRGAPYCNDFSAATLRPKIT